MFDEEYFWTKNSRPKSSKDRDGNKACQKIANNLTREGFILKSYHVDSEEGPSNDEVRVDNAIFQKKLVPFVHYSLNKRKGWEAEDLDNIEELQKISDDIKIVLKERNRMRNNHSYSHHLFSYDYFCRLFNIREVHLLHNESSSDEKKVVYHFFTPPKKNEKFLKKSYCYEDSKEWHRIIGKGMRRRKNEKMDMMQCGDQEYLEYTEEIREESAMEDSDVPRRFYNLEEHIINKRTNRRRSKSSCSSDWSSISL